jgi:hypothetical protein
MEREEDGHVQHRAAWLVRLADQWSQQGGPACARAGLRRAEPGSLTPGQRRRRRRLVSKERLNSAVQKPC